MKNGHERTMKSHTHTKNMSYPTVCDDAAHMAKMAGILLICLLAACSDGSVTRRPGPVTGEPGVSSARAAVCLGADASKLNALYVSPQGTDDGLCGNPPCKTIARALLWAHYL